MDINIRRRIAEKLRGGSHQASDHILHIPQNNASYQSSPMMKQELHHYNRQKTRHSNFKEKKLLTSFLSGMKFVGMTMLIFAVLFGLTNIGSFSKMLSFWYYDNVNPNATIEEVVRLEETLVTKSNIGISQANDEVNTNENHLNQDGNNAENIVHNFPKIQFEIEPPDNRLIIPRLNINVPFNQSENAKALFAQENWEGLEEQLQTDLRKGLAHYPFTADPGSPGRSYITGHSSYFPWDPGKFKDVFATLELLKIGEQFVIFFEGQKYIYTISDAFEVKPTDTWVLDQPLDKFQVALATCTPVGTTLNRWIVIGEQVYPEPDVSKIQPDIKKKIFYGGNLQS